MANGCRILRSVAILVLLIAAGEGKTIELGETALQRAMRAGLLADSRTNSFTYFSQSGGDEFAATEKAQPTVGRKSVYTAAALSALVPGGGQYYLGNRRTARYFFAAEAITWIGYAALRTYGNWRRDDYIRFAAVNANAQLDGKSDDFIDLVGFYSDIRDYNTLGRAFDPEREYLPDTPENHWEWQSYDDQREFRDLKNRSREAYRRSDFMIGLAIIDRIISVVDAVRSAGRINRRIGAGRSDISSDRFRLSIDPLQPRCQVTLTFYPGL